MDLRLAIVFFIAIVFSLSIHEWAHAYAAYKLGDSTAYNEGRVTWNPLHHLDPMGTIMLIFMAFSGAGIGWAKPVPVNPSNLKQPKTDLVIISFAGPFSNLVQAVVGGFLYSLLFKFQLGAILGPAGIDLLTDLLQAYVVVNVGLFFFNMLPFYPLDGSKVYSFFMPKKMAFQFETTIIRWGIRPLLILIIWEMIFPGTGPLSWILRPLTHSVAKNILNVFL